ncbi:MAG: winged-helix domain-containing protein [Chloroflexota bacterium]
MQKTRQQILNILNHHGRATVQEIVDELCEVRDESITAVTVRYHLKELRKRQLITAVDTSTRSKPGRPQHVYELTEQAHTHLPSNYRHLTNRLLNQLQQQLRPPTINVIFEGIAMEMAAEAHIDELDQLSTGERFRAITAYLTDQGYEAEWEETPEGYLLHTSNCPYHDIVSGNDHLCEMDMQLITLLAGAVPRRLSLVSCGETTCSYFFPHEVLAGS